jgi:hypothetical protein
MPAARRCGSSTQGSCSLVVATAEHECRNCGLIHDAALDACPRCGRPVEVDHIYLETVEAVANAVVGAAYDEYDSLLPVPAGASELRRALGELAATLRHWHYEGDSCLDDHEP